MHSLIIHMPSSTARRENVARLLHDLPDAQVIDAVDGRLPEVRSATDVLPGTLFDPAYPFPIGGGEVGCFLSHRKCWQTIVDNDWDAALIAEDDAAIAAETLPSLLRLIDRNATPDCYIRIPPKDREPVTTALDTESGLTLFLPKAIGLQTTLQVVGRATAARLLALTERLDRPVDTFLQMHWVTGQPVQTVLPNGVAERTFDRAGSTVQNTSRSLPAKLRAEIRRALYRRAVARHPQA